MLGNVIKMLKLLPTITVSVCYHTSWVSSGLQVWVDFYSAGSYVAAFPILCMTTTD